MELSGGDLVLMRESAEDRQDGSRPRTWNDFYRVREACQAAEERYGLRLTAPADRTAAKRPSRAEKLSAPAARAVLRGAVTTAAEQAGSEPDLFTRLRAAGLEVRLRFSEGRGLEVWAGTARCQQPRPGSRRLAGQAVARLGRPARLAGVAHIAIGVFTQPES